MPQPALATSTTTACAHCGLPAEASAAGAPAFCCTGCRLAYDALAAAGLGGTYYRLRELAPVERRPAHADVDALALAELDSPAFLEEHTRKDDDSTRAVELFVDGVHCAACVWLIERLPCEVNGVRAASLDLPRARLSLRWQPDAVSLSEIARWLARFGYAARPVRQDASQTRTGEERRLLVKVGVCWALAGNVMLLAFAFYAGLDLAADPQMAAAARYLSLALALPAVVYGGGEFFRRAWASLQLGLRRRCLRHLHMDTPIALGILVGFADSAWATVQGRGEVWFDSITVLIAALLTARWLQLRSRRLAGDATERLLALVPSMARRLLSDGTTEAVQTRTLQAGDCVLVPAGEVVPVDGTVVEGTSALDRAVLTGESRPEAAPPGTHVAAGATNLRAPLTIRATANGADTRLGRLLDWVRDQAQQESRVVLLADRLGGVFVLAVLAMALVTAALWYALDPAQAPQHVVALLVISCPCALGMATPLAMAVGSGQAARAGLFVKSDAAFQLLTEVDAVVLDKTGTLTEGAMTLVQRDGDARAVTLAAALERESNHPIATALQTACGSEAARCAVSSVEVVAGHGLRGVVDGRAVVVGRPAWVFAQVQGDAHAHRACLSRYAAAGHTPVAAAVDGRATATMAFGDALRANAETVVAHLRERGCTVHLLSGDHPGVARAVGQRLGLSDSNVRGGADPETKKAYVEALQAEGRTVAMIGDGVNDMAALQAADVGVAVAGGTTASHAAADVFLTRAGLRPLLDLLTGAESVMRVIRRNLKISLAYNVLGAGAAMAGLVSPLAAAIAMPLSSLAVVTLSIAPRLFLPAAATAPAPASSDADVGDAPAAPFVSPLPAAA